MLDIRSDMTKSNNNGTNDNSVDPKNAHLLLKSFIDAGGYAPGDRLPAERELIANLGITRSALRKGLDVLEREGAIWRHVGKGTFIASPANSDAFPGDAFPDIEKISLEITPVQMMRARLTLEPAIAREAAVNASTEAMSRIIDACQCAIAASTWKSYEEHDDAFHRTIAEATGNVLLQSLYDHLNQVHRSVAWRQVVRDSQRPSRDHTSFSEHQSIVDAINARDPIAAHNSMRDHLQSVSARLFGDV